ncbi:protein kinase domain-containing protein [Streptomyces sp. NPDC001288]|uniref:protein kinase domain-containing protein n=1 Tax=Streptomyces sp. NPDC001297 TaxID=3364559 RepID=UPI003696EE13
MADNPTEEPAGPTGPPRTPASPPTRRQKRPEPAPPSPRTRIQRQEQAPQSPPTRVQRPDPGHDEPANPAAEAAGSPSPPTRVQRPDPAPPGAPPHPPWAADAGSSSQARTRPARPTDPPTRRDPATAHAEFPEALRDRYEPHGIAGAGSEGTVWHVRRLADGADAAVKIAHPGQAMDLDTLEHLAAPDFRRHVPALHEFGDIAIGGTVCGWVAMEYLPTTLEDHLGRRLRDGRPREERAQTERTVRELADLLDFWQTRIDRNPLDLKPANILVRQSHGGTGKDHDDRFQLVVADFGGVARFTASQSYRDFQITALYMAPEQIVNQNLRATPWWTVGLVLYQVFTGRPLYVLGDDARITDEAWTRALIVNHEVDLSAVTDARQNLLLQGLLTKDPDDRWTAAEVRRWLKGETPEVVRPAAPDAPDAARHANSPITFRGTAHHEAESLAGAMARHSQEAADWLAADGGQRLAAWLRDDLRDTSYDRGQLLALNRGPDRPVRAAVAALAFVAVFAPTATPQYRGRRVDADGIARIAQGQGAVAFTDELLKADVPTVAAGFHCAHDDCPQGRCEVLLTLAEQLPATIEDVRARARTLGRRTGNDGGAGGSLDRRETDAAYGLAAALIVYPEQRGRALLPLAGLPGLLATFLAKAPVGLLATLARLGALRHRLGALARARAADAGFLRRWAELHRRAAAGDVRTVPGRADLVAAAVLLPRALRADEIGQDHTVTLTEWWSTAWRPLARRLAAGGALFLAFWLLIWSGAMLRSVHDSGLGGKALDPADRLVAPLAHAADLASVAQTGLCAVALAGAVAFAAATGRISGWLLAAGAAVAAYAGYARPDLPPLGPLHAPGWAAERMRYFLGGWKSWNGVTALLLVPLVCVVLTVLARRQLGLARTAEQEQSRLRRERAEQRRAAAGLPRRPYENPTRWRTGPRGTRDRALFAVSALLMLVTSLWAAVEVRVALDGDHRTPASWGTGQQGASYQSQYVLACAAVCALAALASPAVARRVLGWAAAAVLVLGLWPPPVEPARALSVPVAPDLFGAFAETWGHGAFWAALLLALPLSVYAAGFAVRRTRRAAR